MSEMWFPDAGWTLNENESALSLPEVTYDDTSLWASWIPDGSDQAIAGAQVCPSQDWEVLQLIWEQQSLFWASAQEKDQSISPGSSSPPEHHVLESDPVVTKGLGDIELTSIDERIPTAELEHWVEEPPLGLETSDVRPKDEVTSMPAEIAAYRESGRIPGRKLAARCRHSILKRKTATPLNKEDALRDELERISNTLSSRLSRAQHEAVLMIHRHILLRPVKNGQPHFERRTFCSDTSGMRNGIYAVDARHGVISNRSGLVNRTHGKIDAKLTEVDSDFSASELGFRPAEWLWLCIPGAPNPCHPKCGESIRALLPQTGGAASKATSSTPRGVRFTSPVVTETWTVARWIDHGDRRKRKDAVRRANLNDARGSLPAPDKEFPSPVGLTFEQVWPSVEESLTFPLWDELVTFGAEEEP